MQNDQEKPNRKPLFWGIGIMVAVAGLAALLLVLKDVPVLKDGSASEAVTEETLTEGPTESVTDPETESETEPESETETVPESSESAEPPDPGEQEPLELFTGEEAYLSPRIRIGEVLSGKVRYSSSDESVLTVDEFGGLRAISGGTATVTVRNRKTEEQRVVHVTEPELFLRFEPEAYELEKYSQVDPVLKYELGPFLKPGCITFSSSDEKVAKVEKTGRILAAGRGTAEITAKVGTLEAKCRITVKSTLSSIAFNFKSMTVRIGDTVQLPLIYNPADTTSDTTTTWTSSNTSVVTVNGNGTIHAAGPGNAIITAVCGELRAEATISVVIPVTGVALSQTAMTLNKGASGQLQAAVVPGNTTEERTITFSTDNASVAKVDGAGNVTAVAPGTAHITANHGLLGAVCTVTVLSPLQSIRLNQESLSVIKGFTAKLSVVYEPADTTDPKTVSWVSAQPETVSVDGTGLVTAVEEGTSVITATVNGKTASVEVTVLPYVEVESVTLSETEHTATARGETFTLKATVTPENASEGSVSFSSDNVNVATVDGNGLVKIIDRGTAVISASAGGKSATCTVTVNIPDPDKIVVIDPGHCRRYAGASYYGRNEADMNLVTALACKAYLEAHYTGVQVYLTRSNDQELSSVNLSRDLEARAQFAQDHNADILVSLHYNASNNHSASGALVFISAQASVTARCRNLANSILAQLTTTGLQNRGAVITTSNQYFDEFGNPLDYYAINRHAANRGIPGVIVEHCFMDHDVTYIDTIEKQQHFGVLDAIGIANYLGLQPK